MSSPSFSVPPAPHNELVAFAEAKDCLQWTRANRLISGNRFGVIPPLRALYQSRAAQVVVIKSAQVMVSEWLINQGLWVCATAQGGRGNALYLFPHERQIRDFSRARIDKAIDDSPKIAGIKGKTQNTFLKEVGKGFLYVRGAQTREGLISMDLDHLTCDEIAQYEPDVIDLAQKRLGSSFLAWTRCASTPRYPSDQAGTLWEASTKMRYMVRCPRCSHPTPLEIEMLDPERAIIVCPHCGGDMTAARLSEGEWVAEQPGREWEGYHLIKLLSPRTNLTTLAATYKRVLEGRLTPEKEGEFWNSDAGRSYLPAGGHLTLDALDDCIDATHMLPQGRAGEGEVVMGVDVGTRLHVRINILGEGRVAALAIRTVAEFEDLDELMTLFHVRVCVIDANPETRKAQEFAERWRHRVWLGYYPNFSEGREVGLCVWKDADAVVNIRRTVALDRVQAQVFHKRLVLPHDARRCGGGVDHTGIGDYYRHMQSPIRVVKADDGGNTVARYEHNGPDHFAHAEVYALVAADRLREQSVGGVAAANPRLAPQFASSMMDTAAGLLADLRARQRALQAKLLGEDLDADDDDEIGGIAVAGGRSLTDDPVAAIMNRYAAQRVRHVSSEEDAIETARFPAP